MKRNEIFAQRLRAAMAISRITCADIAKVCECSRQAVHKWRDGIAYPSSAKLMALCKITGCSLDWLMEPTPVDIRSAERANQ